MIALVGKPPADRGWRLRGRERAFWVSYHAFACPFEGGDTQGRCAQAGVGGGDAEAVIAAFGRIPPTVRPPSSRLRSSQGCSRAKRAALQVEAGRQAGRGGRRDGGRGREGKEPRGPLRSRSLVSPPKGRPREKEVGGGQAAPPRPRMASLPAMGTRGRKSEAAKKPGQSPAPSSRLQSGESLSFPLKRLTREQQAARHYGGDYDDAP